MMLGAHGLSIGFELWASTFTSKAADEEHENESTYRNPALVFALTQVRRVREQLLDKQLPCDTARQNKMLLGQQLVESLARVNQLESGLAHMSVQLEDMLCAQDRRQHEVQQGGDCKMSPCSQNSKRNCHDAWGTLELVFFEQHGEMLGTTQKFEASLYA